MQEKRHNGICLYYLFSCSEVKDLRCAFFNTLYNKHKSLINTRKKTFYPRNQTMWRDKERIIYLHHSCNILV